jgi:hypothetical protein
MGQFASDAGRRLRFANCVNNLHQFFELSDRKPTICANFAKESWLGDLYGESDVLDIDMNEFRAQRDSGSPQSVTSSTRGEVGSPMDESE